jgi:hypothetical protein
MYYSSLADREYVRLVGDAGCQCLLLERDQYPLHHLVIIAIKPRQGVQNAIIGDAHPFSVARCSGPEGSARTGSRMAWDMAERRTFPWRAFPPVMRTVAAPKVAHLKFVM